MLINVTLPVYNEEKVLKRSVEELDRFLKKELKHDYEIVVADNGSTDRTRDIAREIAKTNKRVSLNPIPKKGRGRALKKAWSDSKADIVSYMDIDLSTDLLYYPKMIAAIEKGADVAYGSRLSKNSDTKRSMLREVLSRGYISIVKFMLKVRIRDAQCGFKACRRDVFMKLLPMIRDNEWFFDTELLVLAKHKGYRLAEIPVKWVEDPDSKVNIIDTVFKYLRDVVRLRRRLKRI